MKTYAVAMLWTMPNGATCLGSAAIVAPDAAMAAATLVANSRPDPDARFESVSVREINEGFLVHALAVMREQPGEKVVALRPVEPQACSTCGKYPCVCEDVRHELHHGQNLGQSLGQHAGLGTHGARLGPFVGPPLGDGVA